MDTFGMLERYGAFGASVHIHSDVQKWYTSYTCFVAGIILARSLRSGDAESANAAAHFHGAWQAICNVLDLTKVQIGILG